MSAVRTINLAQEALVQAYLEDQTRRLSVQGHYRHRSQVRQVVAWFEAEELELSEVGIQEAVRYQAWLSDYRMEDGSRYQTGTMINYLKTARRLWAWLCEQGFTRANPFMELRYPRLPEHLSTNVLTETHLHKLLTRLAQYSDLPGLHRRRRRYRCHVLAEFLYASGLRISEAAAVYQEHLDLEQHRLYVPCGKGGAPRTAFLTSQAVMVLKAWIQEGRTQVLGAYSRDNDSLFGLKAGRLMEVLNQELETVCRELQLPVITSHGFRHCLGTHLLRSGCDLRHIQVILGHEALQTTQVYTRVDKDDLKKSLDEHHPRQWQNKVSS